MNADVEIVTMVSYDLPGSFFAESSSRFAENRDEQVAAATAPAGAFAFSFHDVAQTTIAVDGNEVVLRSAAFRRSGRFFIDPEISTYEQVQLWPGDNRILLENMRANRWSRVARCRTGNVLPFEDGDQVVTTVRGRS